MDMDIRNLSMAMIIRDNLLMGNSKGQAVTLGAMEAYTKVYFSKEKDTEKVNGEPITTINTKATTYKT